MIKYNLSTYPMQTEEGVEVGAVDVDFAAYLREGDEALVAVVLPRLGGDAEKFAGFFGFEPVGVRAASLGFLDHVGQSVKFLMQRLPFFLGYQEHEGRLCVVGIRITQ